MLPNDPNRESSAFYQRRKPSNVNDLRSERLIDLGNGHTRTRISQSVSGRSLTKTAWVPDSEPEMNTQEEPSSAPNDVTQR